MKDSPNENWSLVEIGLKLLEIQGDPGDLWNALIGELARRCPTHNAALILFNYHTNAFKRDPSVENYATLFAIMNLIQQVHAIKSGDFELSTVDDSH